MAVDRKPGLLLSEKLFLLLVAGSLFGLVGTLVLNPEVWRGSKRRPKPSSVKGSALLTSGARSTITDAARRTSALAAPAGFGSGQQSGVIVARETRELSESGQRAADRVHAAAPETGSVPAPSGAPRASAPARALPGALVSGVEPPAADAVMRIAPAGEEAVSVFVPSIIGLPFHQKTEDVWTAWPDENVKNITGSQGVDELEAAFALVADSRAAGLMEDLVRKGIPISFGTTAQFTGELSNVIAFFHSEPEASVAAGVPVTKPSITFNPLFLHEDPKVLAAALTHEATHFQQFLDGSAWDGSRAAEDLEFQAWSNEAAFWEQVRAEVWPINTFLEQQSELAYRTALRGEGALRDLIAALEWS